MSGLQDDEALRGNRIAADPALPRVAVPGSGTAVSNQKWVFFLFLLTLPLVNPWVRGDGVGYYAYLRSTLIDHDLRFENDYLAANESFVIAHIDAQGRLLPHLYTKTGYVENHFSVGPAILWAPVMLVVHGAVLLADHFGANVVADGYSRPYLFAVALTTASYGFLSLYLAFRIARKYFDDQWTFLATLGIWMAMLPAGLYVFQSIVVACPFRVFRCPISVVLGSNKIATDCRAMGHFGLGGWLNGKCLLSECYSADLSRARRCFSLASETAGFRPAHPPNSKIGAQRRYISHGFFCCALSHFYYSADYLRKSF